MNLQHIAMVRQALPPLGSLPAAAIAERADLPLPEAYHALAWLEGNGMAHVVIRHERGQVVQGGAEWEAA